MKFVQMASGRYTAGKGPDARKGYTLFALGDDGVIYKYIFRKKACGWVALPDTIFPVTQPNDVTEEAPSDEAMEALR